MAPDEVEYCRLGLKGGPYLMRTSKEIKQEGYTNIFKVRIV